MIYPLIPIQEWCDRWGLKLEKRICPSCEQEFPEPRPVAMRDYMGIQYKCPCGGAYSSPVTFVPYTEDKKRYWKEVLGL